MTRTNGLVVSFFLLVISLPGVSIAHPGNTDGYGGHYCWTNCSYWGYATGTWHSHGGYYSPPAPRYTYKCTITEGEEKITLYSASEAKAYWEKMVKRYVDGVYQTYLERPPTQQDYIDANKFLPFSNCNNSKPKWSEYAEIVEHSQERQALVANKEKDRLAKLAHAEAQRIASEQMGQAKQRAADNRKALGVVVILTAITIFLTRKKDTG